MLRWVSRLLYVAARLDEARATAREAVEVLEPLPPGPELGLAYAHMANLAQIDLDVESARSWGERAIALGSELGDEGIAVDALLSIGIAEAIAGQGTARIERALELALDLRADDSVARGYGALSFAAVRRKDWPEADRWLETGIAYATPWCS